MDRTRVSFRQFGREIEEGLKSGEGVLIVNGGAVGLGELGEIGKGEGEEAGCVVRE